MKHSENRRSKDATWFCNVRPAIRSFAAVVCWHYSKQDIPFPFILQTIMSCKLHRMFMNCLRNCLLLSKATIMCRSANTTVLSWTHYKAVFKEFWNIAIQLCVCKMFSILHLQLILDLLFRVSSLHFHQEQKIIIFRSFLILTFIGIWNTGSVQMCRFRLFLTQIYFCAL